MYDVAMNAIERLTQIFRHFPGIGPRQAKRFVYYLLSRNTDTLGELVSAIGDLGREITQCKMCFRYFARNGVVKETCSTCTDSTRDTSMLMIVPRDIDLEAVEKSGTYKGYYFVLGGTLPILEKEPEKRIRTKNLESRIKKDKDIKEIILAMNANSDGENTVEYLKNHLPLDGIVVTTLGRGLSTGAELEYADPETLKNAFLHRTK